MDLRRAIGLADLCELGSMTFAFPTEALAKALVDGVYIQDAIECLADAGADEGEVKAAVSGLVDFNDADADVLFGSLRKGYSILYLVPGVDVPVWPYESAFRYVADGNTGMPSLFRSSRLLDVERHMRESGVLPKEARKEPSDSVWSELSFLAFLYGSLASALQEQSVEDIGIWADRIEAFWSEHASQWLPAFMAQTQFEAVLHTFGREYTVLASFGSVILNTINCDATKLKNRG